MGKVLYSATMSLDGYIAGPDGDMSWLAPYLGPNPEIDALQRRIGALLIGGRTFRGDDPNRGTDKEGAFSGTWTGPSFVVTHDPPADPVDGVEFHPDVETGLAAARAAAGDDYVNILGADIARQCLELGGSTRSWRSSRRSSSGTGPGCSSTPVGDRSGWNGSASRAFRTRRTCGCASFADLPVVPVPVCLGGRDGGDPSVEQADHRPVGQPRDQEPALGVVGDAVAGRVAHVLVDDDVPGHGYLLGHEMVRVEQETAATVSWPLRRKMYPPAHVASA